MATYEEIRWYMEESKKTVANTYEESEAIQTRKTEINEMTKVSDFMYYMFRKNIKKYGYMDDIEYSKQERFGGKDNLTSYEWALCARDAGCFTCSIKEFEEMFRPNHVYEFYENDKRYTEAEESKFIKTVEVKRRGPGYYHIVTITNKDLKTMASKYDFNPNNY